MGFIRGCYENGPQIFFDQNDKDFKTRFWTFAQNFGFPELESNLFDGIESLMASDSERLELFHRLLRGECVDLRDNHVLCRIHEDFVDCPHRAQELMEHVFYKRYSGLGFFRDQELPVHYRICPDSLQVHLFQMSDAPACYTGFMPTVQNQALGEYTGILDVSFDAQISLVHPLPRLSLESLHAPFVFLKGDSSIYTAALAYMDFPEHVYINRLRNSCCMRPRTEAESDECFKRDLFFENPLNLYYLGLFYKDFCTGKNVVDRFSAEPEFTSLDKVNGCLKVTLERETAGTTMFGEVFTNHLQFTFMDSLSRRDSLAFLQMAIAFLETREEAALSFLNKPKEFSSDYWNRLFVEKYGDNEIRVRFASTEKYMMAGVCAEKDVRQCYEAFVKDLRNTRLFLEALLYALLTEAKEDLVSDVGNMVVHSIKLDPASYLEHKSLTVRRFAHSCLAGNLYDGLWFH